MWDATKYLLGVLTNGLGKREDGDIEIILGPDDVIRLGDELSRLMNQPRAKAAEDPPIRKVRCLYDTADLMVSQDYKTRFYAEYWQLKIRYEKLKNLNTRIEAANRAAEPAGYYQCRVGEMKQISVPKHDCPEGMLRSQQCAMEEYLHILELRAVIEGIDLDPEA